MTTKYIRIVIDSKGAKRNADELNESVKGVGFSVNKLAAAIAGVITTQKIAQYADAFTRVQNQILRTVSSTEGLAQSTQALLSVANQTRSAIEPTVELYTALTVSTKDLQLAQEDIIGVTRTINNLFLESGKGAAETSGAIRQLGQALESGALRGDEFNSVAEGAPGILRAIQKETGLTRAELRDLAAEGGLTAEIIVKSLQNYSQEAQNAADKTQVTLAQAFTVADNNLTNFIGQINDATGASSAFAGAIIDLTNYIGSPEFISGLLQAFNTARLTINSVSDSVGDLSNEIQLLKDTGSGAVGILGDAFKNLLPNIRSIVEILTVEVTAAIDKNIIGAKTLFKIFSDPFDKENFKAAMAEFRTQIEASNKARQDSIEQSLKERETIIETAQQSAEAYAQQAAARKLARDSGGLGIGGAAPIGGGSQPKADAEASNREVESAKFVTKSLEQELALRRQVADIYRSNELSANASLYEQQLAQIKIREAEEKAIAQARATEESAQREERLAATLENDKLTQEARAALKAEFDAQEKLAAQVLEEELTAIREQGKIAREELERAEFQARLANAGALGDALISLGQGQSKKIFKVGQTLALAQAAVALPTAVMESFKNGGGYPWGLIPAAAMLATGLKNIQQIRSAGSGLGGGGGGSVPVPSLGGGSGATGGPGIPTTASAQQVEQRRVYELRGVASNDKITVDQFRELMEQDGAVVVLSDSVNDASRRNVPGVTAR